MRYGEAEVNWLLQLLTVSATNLRTIGQRLGASLAAAFGVAGVVAVMVAVLSIAEGFRATLERTGSPDSAVVLRSGTDSEMSSVLTTEDARIVADAPGVRRDTAGPLVSAELFVVVDLPKRSTNTEANVPLRGVGARVFDLRDRVRIVEGRRFEPGKNELIAGIGAASEAAGLEVGNHLRWAQTDWTVVGKFSADGSLSESELWCDARVLQPAYRRGSTFQSVVAKLESPAAFGQFKDALTTDPRISVKVVPESEYYASQSQDMTALITGLGTLVAALMGVGAVFGAILTLYSAVAARTREIATLRAIGFGGGPVAVSVLAESLALAAAGGLIGAVFAYAAFNGYRASTLNFQSFSQVVFQFEVTPALLVRGLLVSLVMGLIGGVPPAIRAARMPIAHALREL
jgi:putative ABC transport system permease protein